MKETNPNNSIDSNIKNHENPKIDSGKEQKVTETKISSKELSTNIQKNLYIFIIIISAMILLLAFILNVNNIQKLFNKKENAKEINNNSFFFEENLEELDYCTNYGLLVYDYYYTGSGAFAEKEWIGCIEKDDMPDVNNPADDNRNG